MRAKSRGLVSRLYMRVATELAVRRARVTTLQRAQTLPFRRILVLCYGNIYRSPLAAVCLKALCSGNHAVQVCSAGFHPSPGRPARGEFVQLVRDQVKLDLSGHSSRVVCIDDIEWADSIVIMDRHNWHALAKLDRACLGKTVWLGGFLRSGPVEIIDPYDLSDPEVHRVVDQLNAATRELVAQVKRRHSVQRASTRYRS
jgi:protein-tyrosine phosphatase